MSKFTIDEKYPQNKRSKIAIRPFFDPNRDNMGLQKYGLSLFDGAFHEEPLACLEQNGIRRYLTGLNEYAPELSRLTEDEKEARIKQIRVAVASLEASLVSNKLKVEDEDFWGKVKLIRPDNHEFWDQIKIRCGNDPVFLEPENDPYDLIKLYAIEAGGFCIVAKSLDEAKKMAVPPKFYLDKLEQTASSVTEVKKLRNKAAAELETMFNKNQNKLFYVAKALDPDSAQYKKSTPNDIIYDNMDKYISGELVDKDKRRTAGKFLETVALDMETLKLKALAKDASHFKFIATKPDGFIYHMKTSSLLGKNLADVVEYLKNPLHEDILLDITTNVEKFWEK